MLTSADRRCHEAQSHVRKLSNGTQHQEMPRSMNVRKELLYPTDCEKESDARGAKRQKRARYWVKNRVRHNWTRPNIYSRRTSVVSSSFRRVCVAFSISFSWLGNRRSDIYWWKMQSWIRCRDQEQVHSSFAPSSHKGLQRRMHCHESAHL